MLMFFRFLFLIFAFYQFFDSAVVISIFILVGEVTLVEQVHYKSEEHAYYSSKAHSFELNLSEIYCNSGKTYDEYY